MTETNKSKTRILPEPGTKVIIKTSDKTYEGIILQSSEMGSGNVVLKLSSGYNIGIDPNHIETVKSLEKTGLKKFPALKKDSGLSKKLPKIALIATGGTIGCRIDYKTGGVHMLLKPEELLYNVPELVNLINLDRIERPFSIASEDMDQGSWQKIAELCHKLLSEGYDGIIITHGTDYLHYTSAALSFMLQNLDRPIALVGGQRSSDRGSFDGAINLICAAHYMSSPFGEVALIMHGSSADDHCIAIRGSVARKMHTSRRDAFRSINQPPLARIFTDGKIKILQEYYNKKTHSSTEVKLKSAFEKNIALVKPHPCSDPAIIDFHVKNGAKGIVIEASGLGHVPTQTEDPSNSWIPAIKRATSAGVVVVIASQCIYGRISQTVYSNLRILRTAGAVSAMTMTAETALVKLGWAIANSGAGSSADPEETIALFNKNIANELCQRTLHDTFLA